MGTSLRLVFLTNGLSPTDVQRTNGPAKIRQRIEVRSCIDASGGPLSLLGYSNCIATTKVVLNSVP